jgi:uncharacterized membrane protein YkvA (DUF1232 family)
VVQIGAASSVRLLAFLPVFRQRWFATFRLDTGEVFMLIIRLVRRRRAAWALRVVRYGAGPTVGVHDQIRAQSKRLKSEALALYFVARDRRTPWFARALAAMVVAYALSPFDLIPDFIPVLGFLDDLVIVPLGIAVALKLVPPAVLADCRARAQLSSERPVSRAGAAFMICVWLAFAVLAFVLIRAALVERF